MRVSHTPRRHRSIAQVVWHTNQTTKQTRRVTGYPQLCADASPTLALTDFSMRNTLARFDSPSRRLRAEHVRDVPDIAATEPVDLEVEN
jgi:hypothetical protein